MGGNRDERLEARKLWHRLPDPTPDDPFGPEEGVTEAVIRTAKWGKEFLDLADMEGNGVAMATLMKEVYQKRRRLRISTYMRHFG